MFFHLKIFTGIMCLAVIMPCPAAGEEELEAAQKKAITLLEQKTKKVLSERELRVKHGLAGKNLIDCKAGTALTVDDNIEPKDWKVGKLGVPFVGEWRVMQIIGPDSALISLRSKGKQTTMVIHNFDTAKRPVGTSITYSGLDGSIKMPPVLYVYGKVKYEGVESLSAIIVDAPEGKRFIVDGIPVD